MPPRARVSAAVLGSRNPRVLARFYDADQNALDHAALVQAIKDGRVTAESNV
jgi:hypothetical protein